MTGRIGGTHSALRVDIPATEAEESSSTKRSPSPRQTAREVWDEGLRPRSPARGASLLRFAQMPQMKYERGGMLKSGLYNDVMDEEVRGRPVPYLKASERERYLVSTDAEGRLWHAPDGTPKPLDTSQEPNREMMGVMDERGRIFTGSERELKHHSSFLAGHPVAAAVTWKASDGNLEKFTDKSGHYALTQDFTQQMESELVDRGVDMSAVEKEYHGLPREEAERKARQGQERLYMTGFKTELF